MSAESQSSVSGTELSRLRGLLDYLQECDPDTLGDKDARQQIESLLLPRKPCDTCRRLQAKLELNAEDYEAELSRLRSSALTPEEAWYFLEKAAIYDDGSAYIRISIDKSLVTKLQSISALRSLSTLEETK